MMRKRYTPTFKAQVVRDLLKEDKTLAHLAAEHGVLPTQLITWRALALEGLPSLFTTQDSAAALTADYEARLAAMYEEIGRLSTQVAWLKRHSGLDLSRHERVALVERERADVALRTQADLLSLSRASLYYRPRPPSAEEVALKHRIDALYTQYPFYGSRRITAQLRREGGRSTARRCSGTCATWASPASALHRT